MRLLAFDLGSEFWLKENEGIAFSGKYLTIGGFISSVLPIIYIFASVILFILLVGGGLSVIINAGSGNAEKTKKGQGAITTALVGFAIIFASYWLIQIIELVTGVKLGSFF